MTDDFYMTPFYVTLIILGIAIFCVFVLRDSNFQLGQAICDVNYGKEKSVFNTFDSSTHELKCLSLVPKNTEKYDGLYVSLVNNE